MKIYRIRIKFKDERSIEFQATSYEETEEFIKFKDEIHNSCAWFSIKDISRLYIDYIGNTKESLK